MTGSLRQIPDLPPRPTFFERCCEEPFRLFFPMGVLFGLSGVSLWPLYFTGLHKFYPGIMHARLMVDGFLGCFVVGFLGTAGPRLTGTPHFSPRELRTWVALLLAAVAAQIAERSDIGDAIFLVLLVGFAARMGWRLTHRTDLPPPGFVLVGFGFLNAMAGTLLLFIGEFGKGHPSATLLGSLLLYQGWVLYLVLGIGGFLLPRFFAVSADSAENALSGMSRAWKWRAMVALAVGIVLLGSFLVEAFLFAPKVAGAMRFLASGVFLATEIPLYRSAGRPVTIARTLRVALVLLLLGLLFPVLWPWQRVAGLHLVFIGGFTLIIFAVATRVILGHSGHGDLLQQKLPSLGAAALLVILAALFRVLGDFFPLTRGHLLDTASYLWMVAAGLWGWRILPKVRMTGPVTPL